MDLPAEEPRPDGQVGPGRCGSAARSMKMGRSQDNTVRLSTGGRAHFYSTETYKTSSHLGNFQVTYMCLNVKVSPSVKGDF